MNIILSVYFSLDRTYITAVEQSKQGLIMHDLNSTENKIDVESIDSEESQKGISELLATIEDYRKDIVNVTVTLPADNVFVTQFPAPDSEDKKDIQKLVDFEIKQGFPQFNKEEFTVELVPFIRWLNRKNMVMAVIIANSNYQKAKKILSPIKELIDNIEISQLNSHNAFMYNYPDIAEKTVALFGVQEKFVDISIINNGKPAYYNLISLKNKNKIGDILEHEFEYLLSQIVKQIDHNFFFGPGLDKEFLMQCWESSMMLGVEAKRLNPFRMMRTTLSQRKREYSSRVFHLYPPCIGGCLPSYHDKTKLY